MLVCLLRVSSYHLQVIIHPVMRHLLMGGGCPYPVLFGKSLHFLVQEEVDSQSVAGAVGEDSTENLTVLVVHFLRHM